MRHPDRVRGTLQPRGGPGGRAPGRVRRVAGPGEPRRPAPRARRPPGRSRVRAQPARSGAGGRGRRRARRDGEPGTGGESRGPGLPGRGAPVGKAGAPRAGRLRGPGRAAHLSRGLPEWRALAPVSRVRLERARVHGRREPRRGRPAPQCARGAGAGDAGDRPPARLALPRLRHRPRGPGRRPHAEHHPRGSPGVAHRAARVLRGGLGRLPGDRRHRPGRRAGGWGRHSRAARRGESRLSSQRRPGTDARREPEGRRPTGVGCRRPRLDGGALPRL